MKKIYLSIIIICLLSCNSKKNTFKNYGRIDYESVLVIKFMGTLTTHCRSVDEKTFWYDKDEHSFMKIRNNNFIDDIKKIKNNSIDNFREYSYAFIVDNGIETDTLYSDNTLKSWILKKNKKEMYFYDEEGIIAEGLRNTYSFFYECW
jgi:hypothetical protein